MIKRMIFSNRQAVLVLFAVVSAISDAEQPQPQIAGYKQALCRTDYLHVETNKGNGQIWHYQQQQDGISKEQLSLTQQSQPQPEPPLEIVTQGGLFVDFTVQSSSAWWWFAASSQEETLFQRLRLYLPVD